MVVYYLSHIAKKFKKKTKKSKILNCNIFNDVFYIPSDSTINYVVTRWVIYTAIYIWKII